MAQQKKTIRNIPAVLWVGQNPRQS